jgi:hypothetical protein
MGEETVQPAPEELSSRCEQTASPRWGCELRHRGRTRLVAVARVALGSIGDRLADADLDALAERLDGLKDEFRSVSRHLRGIEDGAKTGADLPRVVDLR